MVAGRPCGMGRSGVRAELQRASSAGTWALRAVQPVEIIQTQLCSEISFRCFKGQARSPADTPHVLFVFSTYEIS